MYVNLEQIIGGYTVNMYVLDMLGTAFYYSIILVMLRYHIQAESRCVSLCWTWILDGIEMSWVVLALKVTRTPSRSLSQPPSESPLPQGNCTHCS
jgi:hypothetical protein